jgi:uncharacterized DUF497 family protein
LRDFDFSWDKDKNISNIKKHGVSFKEAASVFYDENAVLVFDDKHSADEERFFIIGLSDIPRLLLVCHCYIEEDAVIRIISARKANRNESELYGGAL